MKSPLVSSLTLAGLVVAGLAQANTVRYYSGTECASIEPPDAANLTRYNDGCTNTSPLCDQTIGVVLPISGNNSDTVNFDDVQLRYLDGSAADSVVCQIAVRNSSGTIYTSSIQTSSLLGTGTGTFTWTGTALPNAGGNITNATVQHVFCYLPAEKGGIDCNDQGTRSEVRNYRVDAVNS